MDIQTQFLVRSFISSFNVKKDIPVQYDYCLLKRFPDANLSPSYFPQLRKNVYPIVNIK
ncbi:hypothetical protein MMC2321_02817 [Chitinophaga sp. MM2321]